MMNSGFGYHGNWFCGPNAFFPGPAGWIITLLFWGILIYLAVKLLKVIFSSGSKGSANRLETLKDRYAQGEISEDEYQRIKAQL